IWLIHNLKAFIKFAPHSLIYKMIDILAKNVRGLSLRGVESKFFSLTIPKKSFFHGFQKSDKTRVALSCQILKALKLSINVRQLFPTQLETLIADSQITKHCRHIAQYIEKLLTFPPYRNHRSVWSIFSRNFDLKKLVVVALVV
ncbi:hypothetical protein BpHYR1_037441, partial [Brachionus plicatilis]